MIIHSMIVLKDHTFFPDKSFLSLSFELVKGKEPDTLYLVTFNKVTF